MVNQHRHLPFTKNQSSDKTGRWRNPEGCWAYLPVSDHNRWPLQGTDLSEKRWFGFSYASEFTLPEAVTQKCTWGPCESGRFSYGESPRTPPLEGTSLHRRHNSVERPWGILSLFSITSEFPLPEAVGDTDIHVLPSLWSRSFFLRWITADPSPWGNFTPPTTQ